MNVVATLRYAKGDAEALKTEKAYILNYPTVDGESKSNFVIDYYPGIKVRNLRTAGLKFEENGIAIAQLPRCMPKADFDDEDKVEHDYLPDIHHCIRETLGAEEVYIFDYMIRRREPAFPFQEKTKDNNPQPALSAHIGKATRVYFRVQS